MEELTVCPLSQLLAELAACRIYSALQDGPGWPCREWTRSHPLQHTVTAGK